jgi:hypothetical protein
MTQVSEFSMSIGEMQLPLDISSIVHSQAGQLGSEVQPDFNFRFRYREINFTARCRSNRTEAGGRLSATLGRLPFSAESANQRHYLTEIVAGMVQDLGPIIAIRQGIIKIDTELTFEAPMTAVGLVSGLCLFLVPLKPYLDLISMVKLVD